MKAEKHPQEAERLRALTTYGILDQPREEFFDDLVEMAAEICNAPMALVCLVDASRQWFVAETGLGKRQNSLEESFCAHAILGKGLFEVPNLLENPLLKDNPLVQAENGLRFYAGVPLRTLDGLPLGTLCVIDFVPRTLTERQRKYLEKLGKEAMAHLEVRRQLRNLEQERGQARFRALLDRAPANIAVLEGEDLRFTYTNEAYREAVGRDVLGLPVRDVFPEFLESGQITPLEEVLQTGEPFRLKESKVVFKRDPEGPTETSYVDVLYQALRNEEGKLQGVFTYGVDVTQKVVARTQLSEREERFRAVFEQATDDAMVIVDSAGIVQAWNPTAERLTGWTHAEAMAKPLRYSLTTEGPDPQEFESELELAAKNGKAQIEGWLVRKDRSKLWVSGTTTALHADGQTVSGFIKIFRDTTKSYVEVKGLEFLRRLTDTIIDEREPDRIIEISEKLLGEYLGVSRVVYGDVSPDGSTIQIRGQWGKEVRDMAGTHPYSWLGTTIGAQFKAGITQVCSEAQNEYLPGEGLEAMQGIEASAAISVPILKEGRLIAIFGVHQRDPRSWTEDEVGLVRQVADRVTAEIERSRAQAALKESEAQFRKLVELSPSTVWFGEPDGGLSYISQDFYDATGLTAEESLPNGWASVVHPEDIGRVGEIWSHSLTSGLPYVADFRVKYKDGNYRWITARALPTHDEEQNVIGWLGANTDIHDHVTAEEKLQVAVLKRTEELELAVSEAEAFNYSISHDLRAPLRSIIATSSILLEEMGNDLAPIHRELLQRQKYNSSRLALLIDELLRLSRLARVSVNRETLDLSAKVQEVVDNLEQPRNVVVEPGLEAKGDPELIKTVLTNLIENAAKFSPPESTISVGSKGGVFYVRDEGVGFDPKYKEKIFLPFERLVTEKEFPGTGIGLANVKRIIERHEGQVWAESEPGIGSTFYFTLGK